MLRMKLNLLALLFLPALGCQKSGLEGLVPVSGTATYQGKPVEGADIIFSREAGRPASGKSDSAGNFHLTTLDPNDGAQPGTYKVVISKRKVTNAMTAEQAEAWFAKHAGPPPPSPIHNDLPEKYANEQTSGFSAAVTDGGENRFTFELK